MKCGCFPFAAYLNVNGGIAQPEGIFTGISPGRMSADDGSISVKINFYIVGLGDVVLELAGFYSFDYFLLTPDFACRMRLEKVVGKKALKSGCILHRESLVKVRIGLANFAFSLSIGTFSLRKDKQRNKE